MPKSEEAVLSTLLHFRSALYIFMALDAICFIVILILIVLLLSKLLCCDGKKNYDNIVMNWDFHNFGTEKKLPCKFTFACIVSLIVYLAAYASEFLYFFFIARENIPSQLFITKNAMHSIEDYLKHHPQFNFSIAFLDFVTYILLITSKFLLFVIFIGICICPVVYDNTNIQYILYLYTIYTN